MIRTLALSAALLLGASGIAIAAETAATPETTTATTAAAATTTASATEATTATTIVDVAMSNGSFKTLTSLLVAAGLVDTLKGEGPFTVLAPTDEAFAKIDAATLASLSEPANIEKLRAILTGHVIAGAAKAESLVGKSQTVATVGGSSITIDGTSGTVMIGGSKVVTPDVMASNGIIHVIDTVIMPTTEAPVVTQ